MPAWVRGLYYRFMPYLSKDPFADDAVYDLPPLEREPCLPTEPENNVDNTSHITEYEIGSCSSLPELSYIRPQGFMSSDRISDCSSSSRVVSGVSLVSKSNNNDIYIFDSVYGVIPVEVYEKWRLHERDNSRNYNINNNIHEYNSVNSNTTTINNNKHIHNSTITQPLPPIRPLPPVRGRPNPNLTSDSDTGDRDRAKDKKDFGHGDEKGDVVEEEDKDR